jgi:hypothetical protein
MKCREFFDCQKAYSFSKRTLLHGVSYLDNRVIGFPKFFHVSNNNLNNYNIHIRFYNFHFHKRRLLFTCAVEQGVKYYSKGCEQSLDTTYAIRIKPDNMTMC